ncbi:hypothetical protein LTR17_027060 [Elasticomyces elasticus]|nr:hypothetical protein LTR17_027060 [Elasticomyces elasticus]
MLYAILLHLFTLTTAVATTPSAISMGAFIDTLLCQLCTGSTDLARDNFPGLLTCLLCMVSTCFAVAIDQTLQVSVSWLVSWLREDFDCIVEPRVNKAMRTDRTMQDNEHRQHHKVLLQKLAEALDDIQSFCLNPYLLEGSRYRFRIARDLDRAVSILDTLRVDERDMDPLASMKYWIQHASCTLACYNCRATGETYEELTATLQPVIDTFWSRAFNDKVLDLDVVLRDLAYGVATCDGYESRKSKG